MLASCASDRTGAGSKVLTTIPTATGATDPLCAQVRIVDLSHSDTEDTKAQVIANNAAVAAVCGAPKPLAKDPGGTTPAQP